MDAAARCEMLSIIRITHGDYYPPWRFTHGPFVWRWYLWTAESALRCSKCSANNPTCSVPHSCKGRKFELDSRIFLFLVARWPKSLKMVAVTCLNYWYFCRTAHFLLDLLNFIQAFEGLWRWRAKELITTRSVKSDWWLPNIWLWAYLLSGTPHLLSSVFQSMH